MYPFVCFQPASRIIRHAPAWLNNNVASLDDVVENVIKTEVRPRQFDVKGKGMNGSIYRPHLSEPSVKNVGGLAI